MPAGRPSLYSLTDKWELWINEWKQQEVDSYNEHGKIQVKLPIRESLTLFLSDKIKNDKTINAKGITLRTVDTYIDMDDKEFSDKPEFLHADIYIKREQKKRLLSMGLSGQYNASIAKLILSANHGMHEKTEQDNNHKFTNMPTIKFNGKEKEYDIGD